MIFNRILIFIQRYWWQLTLLLLISTAVASLFPATHLPKVPGTDKTHHFIAYSLLMLPASLARPKYFWIVVLMLMCFGGLIEIIQPYVNRYGEWLDFYANSAGLLCGFVLGTLWRMLNQKSNKYPS